LVFTVPAAAQVGAAAAIVTPAMFGAKGDGRTNDSHALATTAAHVTARGGGEVLLTTYLVGLQNAAGAAATDFAFEPASLMIFSGCTGSLHIRGNGARIKCAAELRFGVRPRQRGPGSPTMRNFHRKELATPYTWMIKVENCGGTVEMADLELDGSIDSLVVGGPWGGAGYQIPAYGLGLYDNRGTEIVSNIYTHHHGLDGLMIDGIDRECSSTGRLENVRSEYNGRQGCSVVGGRSYGFVSCRFNHTGEAWITSSPGAGVDIETEGTKKVRRLAFDQCEFDSNGRGLVACFWDSAFARLMDCAFVRRRAGGAGIGSRLSLRTVQLRQRALQCL
jgi:hypothetical protein